MMFLEGFKNTIIIALCATLIGVILGVIVAVIKVYHKQTGKLKVLNAICEAYTVVIRGTPVVVQLLITYNIIFVWSTHAVLVGILGFGFNSGAYVAEIIRGGINAVDIGQTEAGRALGLSATATMKNIVLPQAVKNVLPAIGNEFISLLKETSVIGFLGVIDLTKAAERVISRTADVYFPY
ncbi:MAG: amino acid ABC transporter permease, partial [Eubacteriales bacterium]